MYQLSPGYPVPEHPGLYVCILEDVIAKQTVEIHRPIPSFFGKLSTYWKIWREKWILWG